MNRVVSIAARLYKGLLSLYPAPFKDLFLEEMVWVFGLAMEEASRQGTSAVVRLFLKEAGELPAAILLEHLHERRKRAMELLSFGFGEDIRLVRWGARLFSLLPIAFYLLIFLFNEDVRSNLNPPVIVWGIVTVFLLLCWRWEKEGGKLAMVGAPILWIVVAANGILQVNFPPLLALAAGGMLALPYLLLGWLFYSLGAQAHYARSTEPAGSPGRSTSRRILIVAALFAVALLAALLFLLSTIIASPTGRQVAGPQDCVTVLPPEEIAEVGIAPPVTEPPTEPLPDSLKGYELYSYQENGAWIFTLSVGLNRVRTSDELSAPPAIEGTGWTLKGVDDLKATLDLVPSGETITWCGFDMPERPVQEDIETYVERLGLQLSIP